MKIKQEVSQLSRTTGRAIRQLEWVEEITGLRLGEIANALGELQGAVEFLKERFNFD